MRKSHTSTSCIPKLTKIRFHAFFNQVDQFKSSHFLWLSAGGLKIAELPGKSESNNFEEEDEDPEGGEG